MSTAISVIIIDSDPLATRALQAALAGPSDIEVVGTASDAAGGVRVLARSGAAVVVVDRRALGEDDAGFIRALEATGHRPAVLVLARSYDEEDGVRVLRHGAAGYLTKQLSIEVLPRLVRTLVAGEAVLSRGLATTLVDKLRQVPETGSGLRPVRSPLSTREWEVLDMLSSGASTRQIADDLDLTVETVRSHVKRVLRKLGAHSRAEAVERARALLARPQTRPSPPDTRMSA